ncbi:MAG: hypothetical protein A4E35_00560 [Methanoregula sp. PtaU1.Bin051]|nr:MAG: hypothetical protein A4E35_00560 [Methanoregula sp. PtaU1.Bin051]
MVFLRRYECRDIYLLSKINLNRVPFGNQSPLNSINVHFIISYALPFYAHRAYRVGFNMTKRRFGIALDEQITNQVERQVPDGMNRSSFIGILIRDGLRARMGEKDEQH